MPGLRKQLMYHDSGIPTVASKGRSNIDMQSLALYMKVHIHDDLMIIILSRSFEHKEEQ